ncbi:MAG TPA: hypothetical protein VGL83_19685 [Stellaceae bacterium]|jgi:hypothetical protein
MPLDLARVDQIVDTLSALTRRRGIVRQLETLRQFAAAPEEVDALLLAAINASLRRGGDDATPTAVH